MSGRFAAALAVLLLAGCMESSPGTPASPTEGNRPGDLESMRLAYDWTLEFGAGAGSGIGSTGFGERMTLPDGYRVLDVQSNWTCPLSPFCETSLSIKPLSPPYEETAPRMVNGTSPLRLTWDDPPEGEWRVTVTRSLNPSVTWDAQGTVVLVAT